MVMFMSIKQGIPSKIIELNQGLLFFTLTEHAY